MVRYSGISQGKLINKTAYLFEIFELDILLEVLGRPSWPYCTDITSFCRLKMCIRSGSFEQLAEDIQALER